MRLKFPQVACDLLPLQWCLGQFARAIFHNFMITCRLVSTCHEVILPVSSACYRLDLRVESWELECSENRPRQRDRWPFGNTEESGRESAPPMGAAIGFAQSATWSQEMGSTMPSQHRMGHQGSVFYYTLAREQKNAMTMGPRSNRLRRSRIERKGGGVRLGAV